MYKTVCKIVFSFAQLLFCAWLIWAVVTDNLLANTLGCSIGMMVLYGFEVVFEKLNKIEKRLNVPKKENS